MRGRVVETISSARMVYTPLTTAAMVIDGPWAESERKRSNTVSNGVEEATGILGLLLRMEQRT